MVNLGDTIIMEGWHGQLNAGDDAFAMVIASALKTHQTSNQVIIFADQSNVLHKVCDLKVVKTDASDRFKYTRLRWAWYQNQATGYVLGGGSLLGARVDWRENYFLRKNRKSVALGLSVGPFSSTEHENQVAEYLKRMHFIGFRDSDSYQWAIAKQIDTEFVEAFDLAVLLPAFSSKRSTQGSKERLLGVSLAGLESLAANHCRHLNQQTLSDIASVTIELAREHNYEIRLFSLCRHPDYNDDAVYRYFKERGGRDVDISLFQHNGDPVRTLNAVSECSHFMSSRLHGAIFSYIANIPLLFISYHVKCGQFARTVGFDADYLIENNAGKPMDKDQFNQRLASLLKYQGNFQGTKRLEDASQMAWRNFKFRDATGPESNTFLNQSSRE